MYLVLNYTIWLIWVFVYWLKNQISRNCCVTVAEFATAKEELGEIYLIQCTYWCNPPVTPILVCIGIFGQYKSLFHCSQHLFCMWTLKTLLYKFTSYVKPSVMKQIFIAYQSNLQSYPNWDYIGKFQIHHKIHLVYGSLLQLNKNRLKGERPLFIILPIICHCFSKITFAVTLKTILF